LISVSARWLRDLAAATAGASSSTRLFGALWPLLLFAATAALVLWQGLRLGVLWDLSYVLDTAWRIALGQVPYRDFPFPYPPLTFLVQALVIEGFGRVYWHYALYCAVAGGTASVLSYLIVRRLMEGVPRSQLTAALLSAPLAVLGIYCIFPHPFYDPDCTLAILIGLTLLLRWEARGRSRGMALAVGLVLAVPLFIKQNTGGAFLGAMDLGLIALGLRWTKHDPDPRSYWWVVAGSLLGVSLGLGTLQAWAGLESYYHWTVAFAGSRRLPDLAALLDVYRDAPLAWWLLAAGCAMAGVIAHRCRRPVLALAAFTALLVPYAWLVLALLGADPNAEPGQWLLSLWPYTIVLALLTAPLPTPRRSRTDIVLPLVLVATVQGAFLSQQLWGSTYGIWPFLLILTAGTFGRIAWSLGTGWDWVPAVASAVVALSLVIGGTDYYLSAERLSYARPLEGPAEHSRWPALAGLTVHGPWLKDLDELFAFARHRIPADDRVMLLPGEALFYYATGRLPHFPVLAFDDTVNPYGPAELTALADQHEIRWLIVKQRLQLDEPPMAEQSAVMALLQGQFQMVARVACCDIYRRR
jgi:hypothetical protein